MRKSIVLAVICFSLISAVCAQDAVPGEILQRTILIKNGNKYGSAFWVDHKGGGYLVTARHLVEGLPNTKATIEMWQDNAWKTLQTAKTLFPPSNDVDIAVLETDLKVPKPYEITTDDTGGGVTMGQQVWFLGYPFQISSQWNNGVVAPFIKRGTMSAIDAHDPNAIVIYIDGFNNPGFSGGPIVYWDFSKHKYGIAGVVKGYKPDSAKVIVNGEPMDTQLMVNSGILIGYSIKHANQAIESEDKQQP